MSRITRDEPDPPVNGRRVGIKDVARHAGVGQGTVSNVLNHPDRVSDERRQAVERSMKELGFVRHEAARQLRAGYSHTLGLLLLDAWNPGFADMARGVEDATANESGGRWNLLFSNSGRDLEREKTALRLFTESRVAGLIVIPHDETTAALHAIRAGGVPVVVVDRAEHGEHELSVAVDDVAGGHAAATHLIELGHRHLAFVGDVSSAAPVHDRLVGAREAASAAGVRLDIFGADLSTEGGRRVGEELSTVPPAEMPTAVMAGIDLVAFGMLQALLQHGIRVPEDLSLVGYDDISFTGQLSVPLTTIRRPHYDMGKAAADLLGTVISGGEPPTRHIVFTPELVVRQSTTSPRRSGWRTRRSR